MRNFNRQNNIMTLCIVVAISLTGCGGGYEEHVDEDFDVSSSGGIVKVDGVIDLNFPSGSLPNGTRAKIAEIEDTDSKIAQIFDANAVMFGASHPHKKFIRVIVSNQPAANVGVAYAIPRDFIEEMGDSRRPRLFAQLYQEGADGEILDYFKPLVCRFDGSKLFAELPPYFFTAERSKEANAFEAILLLASSPRKEKR